MIVMVLSFFQREKSGVELESKLKEEERKVLQLQEEQKELISKVL